MRYGMRGLTLAAVLGAALPLPAQSSDDPRALPAQPRGSLRLEASAAERPGLLAGAGFDVRAGWYVRVGAELAAGARFLEGGTAVGQVRADAALRFHLDPFAERRRGLYAGAGLSLTQLGGGLGTQAPVALLVAGLEGRPARGRVWAVELGVGGGLRLGVVRRSVRRDGYR